MKDVFAIENVRSFVTAWYQLLDVHAPIAECLSMLAEENLRMHFPEVNITDYGTFSSWYYRVINIFFNENHTVQSIGDSEISPDQVKVDVLVSWQATFWEPPAEKSELIALDAHQQWIIQRSKKNDHGLEIVYYNAAVEPFKYKPGSARLGENQQLPNRLFFPAGGRKYKDLDKRKICDDGFGFIEDLQDSPKSPSLRAIYVKFNIGAYTKWHYHTGDQMLLGKRGEGFVEIQGRQSYTLKKNDRIIIPAGVWHRHGAVIGKKLIHLAVTIGRTIWCKDDPCNDHPRAE